MELYSYFRSSAAYRVRIALNFKGIEYKLIPVNLLKAEHREKPYLEINPQGLVPTLKTDSGQIITQSAAILGYIESVYPQPPLLPSNPFEAATIQSWTNIIASDIHPIDNLRVLNYLKHELGISEEQKNSWYRHWIELGFQALEGQIKAAPYCFGNQVTLADIYLVPQVFNALRAKVAMEQFPKILAVQAACNQIPAFDQARPENQPDVQ